MNQSETAQSASEVSGTETGKSLAWLADAPMFIDEDQVRAFYDAVVRPEGQHGKVTLSLERYRESKSELTGAVEGEVAISKLLTTLLPFLDVKAKASAEGKLGFLRSKKEVQSIELYPIDTPQRQLVQLTLHYATNLPRRMRVVLDPYQPWWRDECFIELLPRALVFLDFPVRTKFIPMAAEVKDGKVVIIFEQLAEKDGSLPDYPEPENFGRKEDFEKSWMKYWDWFSERFNSTKAMKEVEDVIREGGGRVEWIDFRVPLTPGFSPLHLHICGRGKFNTGVFAYNIIKRGYKHGLRMVGTLKSEPDMNVLAIFEK